MLRWILDQKSAARSPADCVQGLTAATLQSQIHVRQPRVCSLHYGQTMTENLNLPLATCH